MKQLTGLSDLVAEFCKRYGGAVNDIHVSYRANHQHPDPPGDGHLTCLTAEVEFHNRNLLGGSLPFLTEVFPRLRYLISQGSDFLERRGVLVNRVGSELLFGIVPLCTDSAAFGDALPKLERPSRAVRMPPIAELAAHSDYYRTLAAQYGVEYGLITNNGTVVGPDGGILASATAASRVFRRPLRVTEIGAGTCGTAISLSKAGALATYRGNDFSPEVGAFFERNVLPRLGRAGVRAEMVINSCNDFPLMNAACDVLIVGVYYEAQPDLIGARGKEIARAIGGSGIVLTQSSKPENLLVTELLTQSATRLSRWPWYTSTFCLAGLLDHVEVVTVHDEVMTLASNDPALVDKVRMELKRQPDAAVHARSYDDTP